jgi:hypothetical protein
VIEILKLDTPGPRVIKSGARTADHGVRVQRIRR